VTKEEGEQLANEYGIPFFEASAKQNLNVEPAFLHIARDVKDRLLNNGQIYNNNNKSNNNNNNSSSRDKVDLRKPSPASTKGKSSWC
jgi:Ras-related protein Rab-8A